jgi:hypothetical protein
LPFAVCLLAAVALAAGPQRKPLDDKAKEVAGTSEFLRSVPKRFATLQAVDPARHRVTLLIDGEAQPKAWDLMPDAEVKLAGWWGRLDQFTPGDRVWVWFKTDRSEHPVAIAMLADELSEQDMHGPGAAVAGRSATALTLNLAAGKTRVLQTGKAEIYRGKDKAGADSLRAGEHLYVQSSGDQARLVLDQAAFELRRAEQQAALRKRWVKDGLPGTVSVVHPFSGEMELLLDHEAMRWGRLLKPGDRVTLQPEPPVQAVVKQVQPWHERTRLLLVVNGHDQADWAPGLRLSLKIKELPADLDAAGLPLDLDRPRSRQERIDWFLATIYCTCMVKGDTCTGHFYTLASCNPNACGMPNIMRRTIADKIDRGLTDKQVLEELLKEKGPGLLRPHLLP